MTIKKRSKTAKPLNQKAQKQKWRSQLLFQLAGIRANLDKLQKHEASTNEIANDLENAYRYVLGAEREVRSLLSLDKEG